MRIAFCKITPVGLVHTRVVVTRGSRPPDFAFARSGFPAAGRGCATAASCFAVAMCGCGPAALFGGTLLWPGGVVSAAAPNACPQSHTYRRDAICRWHCGQVFIHCVRTAERGTTTPVASRFARMSASSRAMAHCGCVPPREYDALPHTGQRLREIAASNGPGFFTFNFIVPRPRRSLGLSRLLTASRREVQPA